MLEALTDPLFVQLSLPPMLIGALAAIACALPGNFLLLRRQALLGDAISHVVLPGVVGAFILTGAVSGAPMLLGAAAAALIAVGLIELVKRLGGVDAGAAMGVVFTTLFAAGVLVLELSDTSTVHLDVEHALMGALENLVWLEADGWSSLFDRAALAAFPPEGGRMAAAAGLMALLTWVFWRPLALSSFDETYARAAGLPVRLISIALVTAAALAAVAAFDAVGSILVIAMFICPPATARLLTDRLSAQLWWSVGVAALTAVLGFIFAGYGPLWFGASHAVSAAGMIAVTSGAALALACLFGPHRRRGGAPSVSDTPD